MTNQIQATLEQTQLAHEHLRQAVIEAARGWARCSSSGSDEHGSIETYFENLSDALFNLDQFEGQDTDWSMM